MNKICYLILCAFLALVAARSTTRVSSSSYPDQPLLESSSSPSDVLPAGSSAILRPETIRTVGTSCTYSTIQEAVNAANDGDTIRVEGKTWTGSTATVDIPDKSLNFYGGYDSSCTLHLPGAHTVLDAGKTGPVVETLATATVNHLVDFHDFEIKNGATDQGGGIYIGSKYSFSIYNSSVHDNYSDFGGGFWLEDGSNLDLHDTLVYSNTAATSGGGIYCDGVSSTPSIYTYGNTYIGWFKLAFPHVIGLGNQAMTGGGFYLNNCDLHLNSGHVWYNQATGAGGGIVATDGSTVDLTDQAAQINFNTAQDGGGVYIYYSTLNMNKGQLNQNQATRNGGGLYASGSSSKVFILPSPYDPNPNVQLSFNSADGSGGGVYLTYSVPVKIERTYMVGNTADVSASAAYNTGGGGLEVDNSMVTGGDAPDAVFVLDNNGGTSSDHVSGVTISDNTGNSSAIFGVGTGTSLTAYNLIIWGNGGSSIVSGSGITTIGCSILQTSYPGYGNLVADPLFVNPATGNYHIQRGSPAIDHCTSGMPPRDIDNQPRPSSLDITATQLYDAGADEYFFPRVFLPTSMK
jgi:predicted outer membrane repeat protein